MRIEGGSPLRGSVRPPGDKSISHRALILSALAEGESQIFGLSDGEDVKHTAGALSAMGAEINLPDDLGSPEAEVRVTGQHLSEPAEPLYLGNSGTSMRLLAGVCAAQPMSVVLDGDESLRSRPMERIAEPLSFMGATVAKAAYVHTTDPAGSGSSRPNTKHVAKTADAHTTDPTPADSQTSSQNASRAAKLASHAPQNLTAPIAITGGNLSGIDYTLPVASAQVKGAVLLAGLRARGETVVREFLPSRAHTEEMLAECGADIEVTRGGEFHQTTRLRPSQLQPHVWRIPADPSQAAFWIVAALCAPGSKVVVENIYLGPGREGFVDVLLRMGGRVEFAPNGSSGASGNAPESIASEASKTITGDTSENAVGGITGSPPRSIKAQTSSLTATDISPQEVPRLIDEIPVLAIAAAHAAGTTRFHGVGELRTKESDRVAAICAMFQALGGQAEADGDTLTVQGTGGLRPGKVDAAGDHRIAMSAAVAAMAMPAGAEVAVNGWDAVATSYPRFLADAASLKN